MIPVMKDYLIKNATIINEEQIYQSDLLIRNGRIEKIAGAIQTNANVNEIDATGKWLIPGVIDDQVHFREPGLTHKADIHSESRAAVAGGVTSFMEMPNTFPNAVTQDILEEKYALAAGRSPANYSFFMGVTNNNVDEVLKTNAKKDQVCGIKIFMGSSTGNMLVDNYLTLNKIFRDAQLLIATHCEDEKVIARNLKSLDNTELHPWHHPVIRDEEACFESSFAAVQLAMKNDSRLHILHISTARELQLFTNMIPLAQKKITAEVCVHHLHFTADDYLELGYKIKCNPAIKAPSNKAALWKALLDDRLDVIATDHAPHLLSEKEPPYSHAHSGLPLVQHALPLMLSYNSVGKISLEKIVRKMCHNPAVLFRIKERGFIREGYHADLVLIDPSAAQKVSAGNILYKCGWSPLEGVDFPANVSHTFVNGYLVYANGKVMEFNPGERLKFEQD